MTIKDEINLIRMALIELENLELKECDKLQRYTNLQTCLMLALDQQANEELLTHGDRRSDRGLRYS